MSWLVRNANWCFVAAAVVAIVLTPELAANEYTLRFYTLLLIYTVIALGLNLLVGYTGLVSLGQAGLYAIGAYTSAILATRLGFGLLPCLIAAMVIAGIFGVLLAYPTVRVRGVYLAVVTIAFGIIVLNVAVEWDSLTGGWVGISNVPEPSLFGFELGFKSYFYLIGASAIIAFVVNVNVMNSRFGRAMLATSQSEVAARSLGVGVNQMRTLAFVISAVTAGAAGAYYVFLNKYVSPDIFSFSESVRFLLMVILGGAGTALGPVIGAGLLSYLPEALQQFGEWQKFVYGALLAATMFFLPRGIVGAVTERLRLPSGAEAPGQIAAAQALPDIAAKPYSGDVCLETSALSVHFGGLKALDNVSVRIEAGTVHALIGPNGAGKSTFINAISGIYGLSSGSVRFLGEDTTGEPNHHMARRGLARTFQNTELFPEMSVLENVWVGFHGDYRSGLFAAMLRTPAYRKQESEHRTAAQELLRFVDLSDVADQKAKNLPFGYQRRLEIARALAVKPKLLLLDEPAAGLTYNEIEELIVLIRKLAAAGITVLIIEHHVDLVMAISQHVTVLDYGEVIASGPPDAVQSDPKVIEAYFGSSEAGSAVQGEQLKPA